MTAISGIDDPTHSFGQARGGASRREEIVAVVFGSVIAVAVLVYITATGSSVLRFNDFYREAWPSYNALQHGHPIAFLRLGPPYIGSLIMRAPLAMIPAIWGGGEREVYFASAVGCMIAAPIFAVWVGSQQRADRTTPNRVWIMLLCVLNPLLVMATFGGHPEEILGAVLCVTGVVAAARGRVGWAGVLIALAVINKSSALVAVPVAVAVAPVDRWRLLGYVALVAGSVMVPVTLLRLESASGVTTLATGIGTIFNPPQLLWWFGAGSWIATHAHTGIVLASIVCASIWWAWHARGNRSDGDGMSSRERVAQALCLLTLVCLLRGALDPWNNPSYNIPFIFSLLALEVFSERPPLLTSLYSLLFLIVVPVNGLAHVSNDFQAALYAAIVLPMIAWLVSRLLVRPADWSRPAVVGDSVL